MLAASNRHLRESVDNGQEWRNVSFLENRSLADCLFGGRLGNRVRRTGYHHVVSLTNRPGEKPRYCIFANKAIYELNEKGNFTWRAQVNGGRPLFVCTANDHIFYGEYINNSERQPVSVWAANIRDLSKWSPIHTFNDIRHIHGVFFDPISGAVWITTGDLNEESAIWRTADNFESTEYVIGGSQQTRTVQPLFDEKSIYFASDAPDEQNHIYAMDRSSSEIQQIAKVGGPVFYGSSINGSHFFSTVVEPSSVNKSRYVELWRCDSTPTDNNNPNATDPGNWYKFLQIKKDSFPMKIFQYGQIRFPSGPGDNENLYFTPRSTKYDDISFQINVRDTRGIKVNSKDLKKYAFC